MGLDNNKIVETLRSITDPTSGNNIIDMKLVSNLKIDNNNISLEVNTHGLEDTTKFRFNEAIQASILNIYPDANINIHFTNKAAATRPLSQVSNIIAVASGKGGVGKSTVSTNLALGLKELGAKVGILDADLYGPSIPTMLNIKSEKPNIVELYGKHRIEPIPAYGLSTISIGNIVDPEQAVVLRGPRLGGILKQFINDVLWPDLDYLIIDLPPGTGDIQLTLVQTIPVTAAIIVTTPQEVAVADAIKAMNMFRLDNIKVPIVGVVENMSWFTPDDAPDKKYKIFGEGGGKKLAKLSNSVLLAQLPLVPFVREDSDKGIPSVTQDANRSKAYLEMAKNAARQIAIRNEMIGPTRTVAMNITQQ